MVEYTEIKKKYICVTIVKEEGALVVWDKARGR